MRRNVIDKPRKQSKPCIDEELLELVSTYFLIDTEKTLEQGEDSGIIIINSQAGLLGVFDGCGGLGAKVCARASNKTQAYLASRAVANGAKLWFEYCTGFNNSWDLDLLKKLIITNLSHCEQYSGDDSPRTKGSLIKPYPTTMAVAVFYQEGSSLVSQHVWAGDSRTYILNQEGLAQISIDDTNVGDEMENLIQDGALTNVISLNEKFILNKKQVILEKPTILISATDGCFGYFSSPIEFEYLLLESLENSANVIDWESKARNVIDSISGDDQTLALVAFGFDSFIEMKDYYRKRYQHLKLMIERLHQSEEGVADNQERTAIWNEYKVQYYRFRE